MTTHTWSHLAYQPTYDRARAFRLRAVREGVVQSAKVRKRGGGFEVRYKGEEPDQKLLDALLTEFDLTPSTAMQAPSLDLSGAQTGRTQAAKPNNALEDTVPPPNVVKAHGRLGLLGDQRMTEAAKAVEAATSMRDLYKVASTYGVTGASKQYKAADREALEQAIFEAVHAAGDVS